MEADLIVSCPYNPSHRIRQYKLMNHISKCKKTSKAENMVECPLDKSHIVDRECLREHIKSCSSIGRAADMGIGHIEPREANPPILVNNSTENWDEDPEVPRYDPMKVSAKKPVTRCVIGLTKSEKRKFKDKERMRIANIKGYPNASVASTSMRDTTHDASLRPLRPPRDVSPTFVLQDKFNKNMSIHENRNDDMDRDASTRTSFVPKFHDHSFHKMLYDELVPEDDNIEQSEQSLRSFDTTISLKDYFQQVARENGSFSDRNQETNAMKTMIGATSKSFNDNNMEKEEDKCVAGTSNMSNERTTDKLLALLKNESSIEEVQPMNTMKIAQMNDNSDAKGPILDEILGQFNERLAYLTDIQSTAAQESVRLVEQLKQLQELREQMQK